MSNTIVPANAEGMPKFDRAAVMRLAWEIYRKRFGGEKRDAASRRWAFSLSLEAATTAERGRAQEWPAPRRGVLRTEPPPSRMRTENARYARLQQQISAPQRAA